MDLDCTTCGACCTSESPRHAPVTGEDWSRLGGEAERWADWIGHRAFMRLEGGRCAALVRAPGDRVLCAIYDRRPAICRELGRGSPACEAEIARKGPALRVLPR